jgi:hypothetical protein
MEKPFNDLPACAATALALLTATGPALGFVAANPAFIWGLFNQNLFSFAGNDDRDEVHDGSSPKVRR